MDGEWHSKCLGDLAELHREQVNPADRIDHLFHHFSIPAFDAGQQPVVGPGSSIGSQKFTVPSKAVLVSRLNPRIPRVWVPNITGDVSALASTEFLVLIPRPDVDRKFLKYVCLSPSVQTELKLRTTGTSGSHQRVRPDDALSIIVDIPTSISEQRAIAHILGTLDDKIELNRRMNETLEAMARAIFKDWFVDFGPTRAKMEGRDLGLPQSLANTFPASLVDSELGEIPERWRPSRLGAEVDTVLGGTPSRTEPAYWGGDIPWINSGKANEFRVVEPSEFITRKGLSSSATKLLPSRTTIIAITGATLGQISLTEIETCANQSIIGVLGTDYLPNEYLYFWTREYVDDLLAWQTGGAQQHINKNNVDDLPVICPDTPVVSAYLANTRPVFDRIRNCCLESQALVELRNTLLPRLISGKLLVKDAEKFIAGVEA